MDAQLVEFLLIFREVHKDDNMLGTCSKSQHRVMNSILNGWFVQQPKLQPCEDLVW